MASDLLFYGPVHPWTRMGVSVRFLRMLYSEDPGDGIRLRSGSALI